MGTQYSTIFIGAVVGIAGTLCGAIVNDILGRRSRRQQWISEIKKQEYSAIFVAMSEAFAAYADYYAKDGSRWGTTRERLVEADKKVILSIEGGLFIYDEIMRSGIAGQWLDFSLSMSDPNFYSKASKAYFAMRETLAAIARKTI